MDHEFVEVMTRLQNIGDFVNVHDAINLANSYY